MGPRSEYVGMGGMKKMKIRKFPSFWGEQKDTRVLIHSHEYIIIHAHTYTDVYIHLYTSKKESNNIYKHNCIAPNRKLIEPCLTLDIG